MLGTDCVPNVHRADWCLEMIVFRVCIALWLVLGTDCISCVQCSVVSAGIHSSAVDKRVLLLRRSHSNCITPSIPCAAT